MKVTNYCVHHAAVEELVPTVAVAGGLSTCGAHEEPSAGLITRVRSRGRDAPSCADCGATAHRAYFVVGDRPLCIRHAADAVFPDDDMGAHDMAHAAYIELNRMGVADAY